MSNPTMKLFVTALAGAILALLVAAPMAYKLSQRIPKPFGVIDLVSITNEHAEAIQRGSGTLEAKNKLGEAFAKKLDTEVGKLAQECQCVLVVKAAVMAGSFIDFTQPLRARMQTP